MPRTSQVWWNVVSAIIHELKPPPAGSPVSLSSSPGSSTDWELLMEKGSIVHGT